MLAAGREEPCWSEFQLSIRKEANKTQRTQRSCFSASFALLSFASSAFNGFPYMQMKSALSRHELFVMVEPFEDQLDVIDRLDPSTEAEFDDRIGGELLR